MFHLYLICTVPSFWAFLLIVWLQRNRKAWASLTPASVWLRLVCQFICWATLPPSGEGKDHCRSYVELFIYCACVSICGIQSVFFELVNRFFIRLEIVFCVDTSSAVYRSTIAWKNKSVGVYCKNKKRLCMYFWWQEANIWGLLTAPAAYHCRTGPLQVVRSWESVWTFQSLNLRSATGLIDNGVKGVQFQVIYEYVLLLYSFFKPSDTTTSCWNLISPCK